MFKIADQIFRMHNTAFHAVVPSEKKGGAVRWKFVFSAEPRDINDQTWEPRVASTHRSIELPGFDEWPAFEMVIPNCVSNDSEEDGDEENSALFMIDIFEPSPLRDGRLKFGDWQGHRIDFTLTGKADLYADEDYQDDLAITIHCSLPFDGVIVEEKTPEAAEAQFKKHFDRSLFRDPQLCETKGFLFILNRQIAAI